VLSFEASSSLRDRENLYSVTGEVEAHISNGAFGFGNIVDDLSIGVQKLRHGARASEDQGAVVGAQVVIALAHILPEKGFVRRAVFGEHGLNVGAVIERSPVFQKDTSEFRPG
jgi:hypothetical protein